MLRGYTQYVGTTNHAPPRGCWYCDVTVGTRHLVLPPLGVWCCFPCGCVVLFPRCVAFAGFPCVPEVSASRLEAPRGQGGIFGFPDLPLVLGSGV